MSADIAQLKIKSEEQDILDTALSTVRPTTPAPSPASQSISHDLHKEPTSLSVLGHDTSQKPSTQPTVALDLGISLPKRPASFSKFESTSVSLSPAADYTPTILDKIISFLANLLKRLEQFFIGKLEKRRKKVVSQIEPDEPEPSLQALEEESEQLIAGNRIKWKDRKIKDLEF
ncbi:MAG: hypothetical protein GX589_07575 [Deltaproteobacteria bacterium]|nr:hypothetical protein [Deltaproteobacteria bacterium]